MTLAHTSLRIRLLIGTLFWISATILVAGWQLENLFRQHVEAQFHAELRTHLDQLTANLTLDKDSQPVLSTPLSDPRFNRPFSGLYWQVDHVAPEITSDNSGALRSRSLWDQVLDVPTHALSDGAARQLIGKGPDGKSIGVVMRTVSLEGQRFRLTVAANADLMTEPIAHFRRALWSALFILGLGLVIATLVQVFVGLAPLQRLRISLGRVREGKSQHLEGAFPAEIMPLVDEFNSVLAQNATVVERARTQAGNLAHALKTPLSVLANAANGKDDDLARLVTAQVQVARKQVDYHLARAQAAAATRIPGARTILGPIVAGLVRTMEHIYVERCLEFSVLPIPEQLAFRGEGQDLQEMLGNLLDNACKWASRRVQISARAEQNWLEIICDDDGAGIAADQREAILRRGVRADEQVPGSGLGLAIVGDLAQLYGGTITLADSPLGGARAILELPAAGNGESRRQM